MAPLHLLTTFLVLCSGVGSESDSDMSRNPDSLENMAVNSTSVTYGSLSANNLDPHLKSTLAQMALSPLLVASRRFTHLPLESLFPRIGSTAPSFSATNLSSPEDLNFNETAQINLTSALLNHSLHHGSDDELDRIVFSNLPEGSKLVLKTVKIMKTDEDGNDQPFGEPAISLDVMPIGSDKSDSEEEHDPEESEDADGEATDQRRDLATDASSHKTAGYDSYANEKVKDKSEDYHNGHYYGKDHTNTLTDSQGKKVTDYKGTEKGLTDFDNAHGNAKSNDGERFKKSKKKNKGRKVTGFKRVYHKEEFQRTEHFYDDEEAKKIAESFGLTESKDKKDHGKKDDDRKYHGGRIEHNDKEKVKNEHSTHHGHHKGQNAAHGNSEKHKHAHHHTIYHAPHYRNHHYNQENQHHSNPNHRYNNAPVAYSNPYPTSYDPSTASAQEAAAVGGTPVTQDPFVSPKPKPVKNYPKNIQDVEFGLRSPIADEAKIFRAQKTRLHFPPPQSYYYAPNFAPPPSSTTDHADIADYYHEGYGIRSTGYGAGRTLPAKSPRMKMNYENRYGGITSTMAPPTPPPRLRTMDTPSYYSSVVNVVNRATGNTNPPPIPFFHNGRNLISIDKAVVTKVPAPGTYLAVPESRGVFLNSGFSNWTPISSGSTITGQNYNATVSSQNQTAVYPAYPDKNNSPINLNSTAMSTFVANPSFGHGRSPAFQSQPYETRNPNPRLIPNRPGPGQGQYIRLQTVAVAEGPSTSTDFPNVPNLPISSNFYYGPTLIRNQQHPEQSESEISNSQSQNFPAPNQGRRGPPFSHFMNNLMNSVSGFFNRMG